MSVISDIEQWHSSVEQADLIALGDQTGQQRFALLRQLLSPPFFGLNASFEFSQVRFVALKRSVMAVSPPFDYGQFGLSLANSGQQCFGVER